MRFTLTVFDDGKALLTTEDELSPDQAESIKRVWDEWRESPDGIAIVAECRTQRATTVEIELPVPA